MTTIRVAARHLVTMATTVAIGASTLITAAPAQAAIAVSITKPAASAAGIASGVPFDVEATVTDDAKSVAFTATGCSFSPATVSNVTAGATVSSVAVCSAAAKTATISVKAVDTSATPLSATATRLVTFATSSRTVTVATTRAALPICNGSGTYVTTVTDANGDGVFGIKVTGTISIPATATTAAVTRTVSATTKADGTASFNTSLSAGATLSVASALTGVWQAATASPLTLAPDTCGLELSFAATPPANVTYKSAVPVSGKAELVRASDQARTPLASQLVQIKLGGRVVGTATSLTNGTWSKSVQVTSSGRWTATATTTRPGVSPASAVATSGETTVDSYEGTLVATLDSSKFPSGFTSGDSAPTAVTLTATDPNTGLPALASALKSTPVKGTFALAGTTGLRNFGGLVSTDTYGKAKITGRILGNGTITVALNNAAGITADVVTIPVTAAAKVTLVMSGTTAIASSRRVATVLSSPVNKGSAVIEYRLSTSTGAWTEAKTVSLGQRTTVTMPATTGSYTFRARVAASTSALAGTSATRTYNVTARTAATPVQVDDLSCVSTAGAAPVCTWSLPTTASTQTVTGYTIKVAGTQVGAVTAMTSPEFTLPTTSYKTGIAASVTVGTKLSSGTAIDSLPATPTALATPAGLTATVTGTSAAITWTAVPGATSYLVGIDDAEPVAVDSTDFTATDLAYGPHTVSVVATNLNTDTSAAATTSLTVASPTTTPSAPGTLTATPGDARALLTWTAPETTGGSPVSDYVVETAASADGPWTVFADDVSTATTAIVTGLANGTEHWFRVAAVNAAGRGAAGAPVSTTPRGPAGPPTALTLTPGDQQVAATWSAPASTGGAAIVTYIVEYSSTGLAGPWLAFPHADSADTAIAVNGLANGTEHWFRVAAVTAAGTGAYSTAVPATPRTTPAAPTGLTATPGAGRITLTWTAPASGGSPITGYTVQYRTTAAAEWLAADAGTATTATITGLTNGTAYTLRVLAANAAGVGAPSDPVLATPRTTPSAPMGLTAVPSAGQVTLSWGSPAGDGGASVTDYVVQYRATAAAGSTTSGSWITVPREPSATATAVVTGLVNGTSYDFSVAAVNAAGVGEAAKVTATPRTVPGAVTALTAAAGSGQVSLAWTAPTSTGGSPITDYRIEYAAAPAGTWQIVLRPASTQTAFTVTGLTNGTSYAFRVSAVNAAGAGPATVTAAVTPQPTPGAPTALQATPGNGTVTLAWYPPSYTGGTAITDYVVQYSTAAAGSPGAWVTPTRAASTQTTFTVAGLTNGTPYAFRVAAVTAYGTGDWSTVVTATPATVPGAPTSLAVTVGNAAGSMQLAWVTPSSNGGSPIVDYVITCSTATSGPYTTINDGVSTSTSAVLTGLTVGATYYCKVAAVNAIGVGSSILGTFVVRGAPAAPTGLTVTPGNGQVSLAWTSPQANGGATITDYVIQYKVDTATSWSTFLDQASTVASATVTGLTNGTVYVFRVAAVNSVGTGEYSTAVSAVPGQVPGAPTALTGSASSTSMMLTWQPPATTGSSPIVDYRVEYSTAGTTGPWYLTEDGISASPYASIPRPNSSPTGTLATVSVRVSAVNASGVGLASSPITVTFPA